MKCICKRRVKVWKDEEGWFTACSKCGRESEYASSYEGAIQKWIEYLNRHMVIIDE